jgi:hypothetical protein
VVRARTFLSSGAEMPRPAPFHRDGSSRRPRKGGKHGHRAECLEVTASGMRGFAQSTRWNRAVS